MAWTNQDLILGQILTSLSTKHTHKGHGEIKSNSTEECIPQRHSTEY